MFSRTLISASVMSALAVFASTAYSAPIVDTATLISTDTILSDFADTGEAGNNRYAAIISKSAATTVTVAKDATLTVSGNASSLPAGAARLYGLATENNNALSVSGNLKVDLTSTSLETRAIRANNGDLTITGNTEVTVHGGSNLVMGAEAWTGSTLTFAGNSTTIDLESTGGRITGVQNWASTGAVVNFNADTTTIKAVNSASATTFTQGLLSYQSTTNFAGNANITVVGGTQTTYGVDVQCDPGDTYDTVVNFNGAKTVVDVTGSGAVYAVRPSGAPGAINFNGSEASIKATSISGLAAGIASQYGAEANFAGNVEIEAQGKTDAVGMLNLTYGGTGTTQFGEIHVAGTTSINVTGKQAYGIVNSSDTAYSPDVVNETDGVFLNGATKITVSSDGVGGVAVGVSASNVTANTGLTPSSRVVIKDLTLVANGTNGAEAKGIVGSDNAHIALNGNALVSATGKDAVGLELDASDISVNGSAQISGSSLGVSMKTNSVMNIGNDSSLATNSMESIGKTDMKANSLLNVSGSKGGKSTLGDITAGKGATVEVGAGAYTITSFAGDDKSLVITDLKNNEGVEVKKNTGSLNVVASGSSNDQYGDAEQALEALQKAVDVGGETPNTLTVQEGAVNNSLTATLDESGKVTGVVAARNKTLDAVQSINAVPTLMWRHDINDLTKRMGELRDSPEGIGAWVRFYGSEMEYGSQNLKQKSTSIQVGADKDVGFGWKVGGAFTYTDSSSEYDQGDSDTDSYGFAAYGSWLADNGLFVDVIAKYTRMSNDFNAAGNTGSFDSNAYSVSAEAGWHFKLNDVAFVEPQAELSYGRVMGETFSMSNGVKIEQKDFDSLIGRIGVRAGFYFPDNKGTIYARASALYDFEGDLESTAYRGVSKNTIKDDLGGAFYEFGVGANFNLTDRCYTYVDLERNNAGKVKENWRWNVGVRYTF